MDFMKLFGTVIAVFLYPGCASKINGHRICRRGTERPCYQVFYVHDSRRRLTYEEARDSCRSDGGELLSIETESEQRLVERFIQQLRVGEGDYWIGLRRNPQRSRPVGTSSPACPSQYYWLDGSRAKFRNWHWDEPSCGAEMCTVLYHQPSAPPDEQGHFLFQWNDDNCNSKNNYVCKYALAEKQPAFTEMGKTVFTVPSLKPKILSTTESVEKLIIALPEPSVSLSDNALYIYYTLCVAGPVLLLLLLLATGFLCYRRVAKSYRNTYTPSQTPKKSDMDVALSARIIHNNWQNLPIKLFLVKLRKRRKPDTDPHHHPGAAADPCVTQGPYAFSDVTKLHYANPDCTTLADLKKMYFYASSPDNAQCDDYENLPCPEREQGFVTNDIYEICRQQGRRSRPPAGWVENEIYG